MVHARHPEVATVLVQQLNGLVTLCLREVREAANRRATGCVPPSWKELAAGARPVVLDLNQFEWWGPQRGSQSGWQHEAASRIELWWAS